MIIAYRDLPTDVRDALLGLPLVYRGGTVDIDELVRRAQQIVRALKVREVVARSGEVGPLEQAANETYDRVMAKIRLPKKAAGKVRRRKGR